MAAAEGGRRVAFVGQVNGPGPRAAHGSCPTHVVRLGRRQIRRARRLNGNGRRKLRSFNRPEFDVKPRGRRGKYGSGLRQLVKVERRIAAGVGRDGGETNEILSFAKARGIGRRAREKLNAERRVGQAVERPLERRRRGILSD